MAFPTFAMGCLPSYAAVGSTSIVLLTLVRLLQGLSVGGQLMSSLIFTLERHPKKSWGLYGSYVMAAANLGTLLGGLVATILRRSLSFVHGMLTPSCRGSTALTFCAGAIVLLQVSCRRPATH